MKTEYLLLLTYEGPTMTLEQVAKFLGVTPRTLENQIYGERCPIPMFKVGSRYAAHISDVARYIDEQREAATKEKEGAA